MEYDKVFTICTKDLEKDEISEQVNSTTQIALSDGYIIADVIEKENFIFLYFKTA